MFLIDNDEKSVEYAGSTRRNNTSFDLESLCIYKMFVAVISTE